MLSTHLAGHHRRSNCIAYLSFACWLQSFCEIKAASTRYIIHFSLSLLLLDINIHILYDLMFYTNFFVPYVLHLVNPFKLHR